MQFNLADCIAEIIRPQKKMPFYRFELDSYQTRSDFGGRAVLKVTTAML